MHKTGFILLLVWMFYILRPVYPYLEYALNKDYITKVFCINKDKPELKCNGKCHLNQQIKNQEKQNKEHSVPAQFHIENIILYFTGNEKLNLIHAYHVDMEFNSAYHFNYSYLTVGSIFRPPPFRLYL